ncbi:MAG: BrnT family toxin [Acidobacteriaceae bacterium]
MEYEWGPQKAAQNFKKHGVRFADAVVALEDDRSLTFRDPGTAEEERWIALAKDASGSVLVVVYTWRGEHIRLISARRATPRERSQYGEQQ